jgi:hypothetical protein
MPEKLLWLHQNEAVSGDTARVQRLPVDATWRKFLY